MPSVGGRCWTRGILGVCGPGGGGRTLGELRFLLRSGHEPMRAGFAGSQPRPGQERGKKGRVGGGSICQGGRYQVHLVEGNPREGVPASAISGVSARGPPKTARMYLDACSLSQPGASIGRVKKEGDANYARGEPESDLLCRLPREGRSYLHGPWTECRLRGHSEKPVRQFLDARSGDRDSERGDKGGPYQGKRGRGELEETDQVLGFLLGGPRRRAGATCVPRQGHSAAGCGDGLRESPNLRSR